MSRLLANPPLPTSDNISFLPYPLTPLPLKKDVICVSPLIKFGNFIWHQEKKDSVLCMLSLGDLLIKYLHFTSVLSWI